MLSEITLSEYISEKGISPSQFAKILGVTSQAVDYWIKGKRIPRPAYMQKIYSVTNGRVPPGTFLRMAPLKKPRRKPPD